MDINNSDVGKYFNRARKKNQLKVQGHVLLFSRAPKICIDFTARSTFAKVEKMEPRVSFFLKVEHSRDYRLKDR